jgi:hypothetical protein
MRKAFHRQTSELVSKEPSTGSTGPKTIWLSRVLPLEAARYLGKSEPLSRRRSLLVSHKLSILFCHGPLLNPGPTS